MNYNHGHHFGFVFSPQVIISNKHRIRVASRVPEQKDQENLKTSYNYNLMANVPSKLKILSILIKKC